MPSNVKPDVPVPAKHAPFLDLLRAVAAFLVVIGHTRNLLFTSIADVDHPGLLTKGFWLVTVLEHEAVVIFFVLSGYLVGGTIVNSLRRQAFDLTSYLVARFARIYIVYAPALVVTALIFWCGGIFLTDPGGDSVRPLFSEAQPDFGGLRPALCHFAAVQGFLCTEWKQNPALWSLGYEWVLYLFAPAILGLVVARGLRGVRLAGVVLLLFGAAAMSVNLKEWAFWFTAWFLGVAAFRVSGTWRLPMAVGLVGLAIVVCGMPFARSQIIDMMTVDLAIAIGAALALACRPLVALAIAPRFFGWAAGFSYSLYATHFPMIFLTAMLLQNVGFPTARMQPTLLAFSEFGLCILISVGFAYVFSLFTERQTDRLRSWLRAAMTQSDQRPAQVRKTGAIESGALRVTG